MTSYWSVFSGGSEVDLSSYCAVNMAMGIGMPPITNYTTAYGAAPGSVWQGVRASQRVITLQCVAVGDDLESLHYARKQLAELLKPGRDALETPVELRYSGAGSTHLAIDCYYDGGLELGSVEGFTEEFAVRFVAPDPLWREEVSDVDDLSLWHHAHPANPDTMTVSYVAGKVEWNAASWDALLNAGTGTVYAIVVDSDDTIYVGGDFVNWAGIAAADYIVKRTGTRTGSWAAVGTGLDGVCHALALGPDGKLYAAGAFTHAGGGAATRVACWDGASWAAVGSGCDDTVYCLAFDAAGYLYAGGNFLNAGGGACTRVAKWTGAAWVALGSGLNGICHALAFGRDGFTLFAGGAFTTAGGVTVNYVARYSGATWYAMGATGMAGGTPAVYTLAVGPDDRLYAGGNFTTAGGVSCLNVAVWNGNVWSPLASGLAGGDVRALWFDSEGVLWAGGAFTGSSGSYDDSDNLGTWNGYIWSGVDIVLPACTVYAGTCYDDVYDTIDVFIGFSASGTATRAKATSLTVGGTAPAWCVWEITGPALVYIISNESTGERITGKLYAADGDTLYVDLRGMVRRVWSSRRGDLLRYVAAGNQFASWALETSPRVASGLNVVSFFATNTGVHTGATLYWLPRYWSVDGVAAS